MSLRYNSSLVIGNFHPTHMGHIQAITEAAVRSHTTYVMIYVLPDSSVSGQEIMRALKYTCPKNVNYTIVADSIPVNNYTRLQRVHQFFAGKKIDAFFSGQKWGKEFAEMLGAEYEYVSKGKFPITSEALMADVNGNFEFLVPYFKRQMRVEVVMMGPECSGKTSLTKALAHKYRAKYIPDVKRWYTEGIGYDGMEYRDLRRIFEQQRSMLEIARGKDEKGLIFMDGDGLQLQAWAYKLGLGFEDVVPSTEHSSQLKILCTPDFAYVHDTTRSGKADQVDLHLYLTKTLDMMGFSYIPVHGSKMRRICQASRVVDKVLKQRQARFLPMPF